MSKYEEAIQSGYSHQEVVDFIKQKPEYTTAIEEGYSDTDVLTHFGVPEVQKEAPTISDVERYRTGELEVPQAPIVGEAIPREEPSFIERAGEAVEAIAEPFVEPLKLGLHTIKRAGIGIGGAVENLLPESLDPKYYSKLREANIEEGERINKAIDPKGKALLKPTDMAQLISEVTVGLKATSPRTVAAVDGLLGFVFEHSKSGDSIEALKQGIYQGGASGIVTQYADEVLNALSRDGADKALDYLKGKYKLTDSQVSRMEKDWLDIMEGEHSSQTKVKAIIDSLGKEGAGYKATAEMTSPDSARAIINERSERIRTLQGAVDEGDIVIPQAELATQIGSKVEVPVDPTDLSKGYRLKVDSGKISDRFEEVKGKILSNHQGVKVTIPQREATEVIEQLQTEIRTVSDVSNIVKQDIVERISKPMNLQDAIQSVEDVNELIRTTKNEVRRRRLQNVKELINKQIDDTLTVPEKFAYSTVKNEYRIKKTLQGKSDSETNNRIGKLLGEATRGRETHEQILKGLADTRAGEVEFNDLSQIIGTKNTAKLEQGIIKEVLSGRIDDISYANIDKLLKTKGFHSKEAKHFKEYMDKVNKSFATDDYVNQMSAMFRGTPDQQSALTADLMEKARYATSGAIWRWLLKNTPFVKGAKDLKALDRISKVLSKEAGVRKLELDNAVGVVRKDVEDILVESISRIGAKVPLTEEGQRWVETKRLEHKPRRTDAVITPRGHVVPPSTAEEVMFAERTSEAMRKRPAATYSPTGQFRDPQFRRPEVEIEVIEEAPYQPLQIESKRPAGRDIEDVEIIEYGKAPKRLSEEQAKRWNNLTKSINQKQSEIDRLNKKIKAIGKSKSSKAKKDIAIKKAKEDIKKIEARIITLNSKLPKM